MVTYKYCWNREQMNPEQGTISLFDPVQNDHVCLQSFYRTQDW